MNRRPRSTWFLNAFVVITAALLIMTLTKTSWAMPLGPDIDPRSPTRPTAIVIVQSGADDGTAVPANCPGPSCRLRDALAYAAADDTITFSGDYTITLVSELTINKNLTLDGTGHTVTISGNNAVRAFTVNSGVTFNLQNLTVTNSGNNSVDGGGLYNWGTASLTNVTFSYNVGYNGGGIRNDGALTVTNCTFLSNSANVASGGAIVNVSGTLTVVNSTFSGNTANTNSGGGIANMAALTVMNSTFSNNSATAGGGIYHQGGTADVTNSTFSGNNTGIYSWSGTLNVTNSTLSGNSRGLYHGSFGTLMANNTLVAGNSSGNCAGTISGSNNLADDATCGAGFTNSSSIRLGVLGAYGGSTQTFPLLPGSSAIDATSINCPAADQRGVARPQGVTCDIGAFESRGFTLAEVGGDNQSTAINTAFAYPLSAILSETGGSGLPGAVIAFTAPASGASIAPPTTVTTPTNASGTAIMPVVANDIIGGPYSVTANASDVATVTFTLTNTCGSAVAVTNNADSGTGSLRQALADVCAGGTITFAGDYTITLASELIVDKNLTITGVGHNVTINGNNAVRVFAVDAGVTFNLQNLTVTNGHCSTCDGGGIYNQGNVSLLNVTLSNNTAQGLGGGLYNDAGSLTLTNVTFSGNSASNGGGLYNDAGSPTLTDVTFTGNSATTDGGGIYTAGSPTLSNTIFISNSADTGRGGGIDVSDFATVTVAYSLFDNNFASSGGGAIATAGSSNSTLSVSDSTFTNNQATSGGGALYPNCASATVYASTFVGNQADTGGAIHSNATFVTVTNSTFVGNSAVNHGAIDSRMGTIKVDSSTFMSNTASGVGDSVGSQPAQGGSLQVGNSILSGSDANNCDGNVIDLGHNLSWPAGNNCPGTQSAPLLGSAANNGGATWTVALLPESPAIDAGDDAACPPADQRGVTRPQGAACDIGAFEVDTYLITPTAGANGSIAPSTAQLVYRSGSQTFLIAPDIGYQIVDVQVDGVSQGAISLYIFNNVTASHTISATFTNKAYTITPSAGAHGSISPNTPQTVNYGDSLAFNFTPDSGYQVANVLVDGVSQGAMTSYTFSNVMVDHSIMVSFAIKTYTIAPSAGPHGSVSPATVQTVNHGDSLTFNIAPDTGYHIADVIVDGVSQGAIVSYTFGNVTTTHTIAASFAINTYTITPSAGANGSITPGTPQTVNYGTSKTFNITPNTGYHVADVLIDGVSQGPISSYTFDNIAANHTISASFAINTYTITPSAGANGSITPNTVQTVNYGGSVTFNFTPNPGSQVANVLIDGVSQGPLSSYTFSNVTADHTIVVSFTGETHVLTPSAGPNGVISPYTPQTVGHGGSATFTITPNSGYHIADVGVDGVSQGPIGTYTFTNVTADHTITAAFAINTYTLSPTAGPNGSITPSTPQTVNHGGSRTFTIVANTNYRVADVRVDGISQGAVGTYTFNNVTANHTITAAFTTSGPQTRTVGVITITADSFVDLGGGVTRAAGNIRLGQFLYLTGSSDTVLYTSGTLTATGKLTVRSNADQIDVFTGSFRAATANGIGTLIVTPTYQLNQLADWPLVAGVSVSAIDLPASQLNVTANLGVQVYEIDATVPVTFAVSGTANDIVYSGQLSKFEFATGGLTVTVPSGAVVSNIGISIPSSTVTLPEKLGGASGTIEGLSITKYGVTIAGGDIALPEIKIGDGSKVKITDAAANLALDNDDYKFVVSATLQITLPGNNIDTPVSFAIENGEMSGTIDQLDLAVAGAQLGLQEVAISNDGLAVAQATLTLPASLGGATTTLTDVSINGSGLHIGSGTLQLAEIKIGDGSKVKIVNPVASLASGADGYTFGLSGTLQLRLPQNSQNIGINGTVNSAGQFTATISQITLKLANVDLKLSNLTMNNSGLTVVSGTLQLPAKLGNVSGVVNNISITSDGLSIEGGAATFPIPNFKIGGSSGFSVSNARAKLIMTNNGASYRVQIDGTVAIAVRGSNASATGTISVDDAGNLSGSVSTFALAVAGLTLNAKNIAINNDGSLAVGAADLKLPSGFGGASASVYNVSLANGELSIGGGKFTLPEIKAGGFRLKDLGASLIKVTGGYEISAKGFASFPAVSGGAGCKGIGASATLFVNALGQPELALAPDQPNGLSLKNAAFNFECQIPIGTTGFSITGISGAVTLGETSTQVNVALQIATSRKLAGTAILSADAAAQLITDPFDLSLTGAVRVFTFQVGGANAHLNSNSFNATLWVDMRVINGRITFNAWSDYRGFHMSGSGNMTVGLAKGAIFNSLSVPYPCCECGWRSGYLGIPYWWCGNCQTCWTASITVPPSDWLFNTSTQFGEFSGDRWGVKGTVSLLGYSAGFFVDNQGHLSVGNVDTYHLIQPLEVNQALAKWQAAQLTGLASPDGVWETDGIRFVNDGIIVNQPLTMTTDVIFALQRNQSLPTLTLMTPLGVEITPDNLPADVQFTEVQTYTRNISPTATSQTIDGVSVCAAADAADAAAQTALLRFTHARTDLGAIDVLIDGVKTFANADFGVESNEQVIDAGSHTIELVPANQLGPIEYSTSITITGNAVHRLIAAGDVTQTAMLDLVQGTAPVAGKATIRFAHAAPDVLNFDVVVGNDGHILWGDVAPWSVTDGFDLDASRPYTLEVYAAGTNQLLAQLPNVTLTGRGTYSLIALGSLNGTPALQLVLQADTLPMSQLRLVNAIAGDQPIDLWTQGITLFANLPYSATTPYYGFASDSIGFQLTPAGISTTVLYDGSIPLQGEADHTLVALDYVTQTQAVLLVDDNRLPAWGQTRVRFVHASPNVAAVDVAVQGGATWFSDVTFKNAGDYVSTAGGTVTLEVRDHNTSSVLLTVPNVNLIDGNVYTLFLMGVDGGSPALQLVPQIDLVTAPDIQTQYVVHQAQTGTWGMKLNGDIVATDQYMLTALGSNPAPVLSDLSAGISGTTSLTTSWRLTSDELGTPIGIYANPGPITAGLYVTDDFIYTGQALATNLTSADPNWVNGTRQTHTFDLNQLPSGAYHIWFEANDDRNAPVRQYAPQTIVVDHAASWPLTWTAAMSVTPSFRELDVQWSPHPNVDADGYVLNVASPNLTETLAISTGLSTSASVTALDPDQPYSLTLTAIDNDTGHVSQSQTVIGVPAGAPFALAGSTDAINLIAGQSQSISVDVSGKEPYPGVVSLQVGCVHLSGAACDLSIGGLTALFDQEIVTPTLAGATVPVVISSTEKLAAGNYVVPIIASGNGLTHTLEVAVLIQTQDIAVTAPTMVTLGQDQVLEVPIATAGTNGTSNPIGLHVDNVPAGLLWSIDRSILLPGENATLTITDTALLESGVYTLDLSGDDGLHTSSAHITLTVNKPRFALSAPVTEQVVPFGWVKTATFALDVTPLDGWTDPVTLVFDPGSAPALGTIGLTRDPASGLVASTLTVTPTERVYLLASTRMDMPPGQYTLNVEANAGERQQTLELMLTVKRMELYLPLIARNYVSAPDLVVTSLKANTGNVQVVIKNQGNQLVTDAFYVDVYINPNPVPTAVNQTWSDGRSTQGLTWGVTAPVQPGQVLTLTIGDAYYLPEYSVFMGTLPIGTPVYAQVDVFDPTTTYGAVREIHEINGAPYNNILGPVLSTATLEAAQDSSATSQSEYFLPIRLKVF